MAAPNVNSNVETRTMCVISTSFECNPREREREKGREVEIFPKEISHRPFGESGGYPAASRGV